MPLAPCQNNLWCIDRIDFKWRPTACPESLGTGIYFHYASCCVSSKSFSLLGLNIGDLSLWLFFCFLSYIFHNPESHWWTRLEFSWHRIFDFDGGFLPNYLLLVCENAGVFFLHLCAKISQAIKVCVCVCMWTALCSDGKRVHWQTHNLVISTGSAMMSWLWKPCLWNVVCTGFIFPSTLHYFCLLLPKSKWMGCRSSASTQPVNMLDF